jgi:hypothetical protein
LIVGAADGLGGKVIRTVSFLGWTLPVDFFMGVTGAPGTPGGSGGCGVSAIVFQVKINPADKLSNQIRKQFYKCSMGFGSNLRPNFHRLKLESGLAIKSLARCKIVLRQN